MRRNLDYDEFDLRLSRDWGAKWLPILEQHIVRSLPSFENDRFTSYLESAETSYILSMLSAFFSMVSILTPLTVHPLAERNEDKCLHSTFGRDRVLFLTTLI